MIEAVVAGLVVAALSGITVLAYRKPELYGRIGLPLICLAAAVVTCSIVWNGGLATALSDLLPFIAPADHAAARAAVVARLLPDWLWVLYGLFVAYLLFLVMLPHLIERELPEKNPKPDNKPKA